MTHLFVSPSYGSDRVLYIGKYCGQCSWLYTGVAMSTFHEDVDGSVFF